MSSSNQSDSFSLANTPNTTIDNLPIELLPIIFEYCDLVDLSNCRLVNKMWNFSVDKTKPAEIVFSSKNVSSWIYKKEPINSRNQLFTSSITQSISSLPFDFKNLSKLLLCGFYPFDVDILSGLSKLEHLELHKIHFDFAEKKELLFPDLKILCLLSCKCLENAILFIDAVKLQFFYLESDPDAFKLRHFDSLKELTLPFYSEKFAFKNVEILTYHHTEFLNPYELFDLTNLKELHCEYLSFFGEDYVAMERIMDKILSERKRIGKENLKIYFDGVELVGDQKVRNYGFYKKFYLDLSEVERIDAEMA